MERFSLRRCVTTERCRNLQEECDMKFRNLFCALSVLTCLCLAPLTLAQKEEKHDAAWYKKQGYVQKKDGTWYKRDAAWYKRNGYVKSKSGTWHKRDAAWYKRNGYVKSDSGTWHKKDAAWYQKNGYVKSANGTWHKKKS
jgi:hypothetical protein